MLRLLILVVLSATSLAHASTTSYFGNGGDGYLKDSQVTITDLMGAPQSPWIGDETSPALDRLLNLNWANDLQIPRALLLRKLTDLEKIQPGLGVLLVESINAYLWTTTTTLGLTCDTGEVVDGAALGAQHVQIANRLAGEVTADSQLWSLMDDGQKIALVVHEATYSFVDADNANQGSCEPPSVVRHLVRLFFTPNAQAQVKIPPLMRTQIPVSDDIWTCLTPTTYPDRVEVQVVRSADFGEPTTEMFTRRFDTAEPIDGDLEQKVRAICTEVGAHKGDAPLLSYNVKASRKPYYFANYKTGVKFLSRREVGVASFYFQDADRCVAELKPRLQEFYAENSPNDFYTALTYAHSGLLTPCTESIGIEFPKVGL